MSDLLDGIRVVEVAMWGFVPSAGSVLAEWGADVIKVEHPERPDPLRGLAVGGVAPGTGGVSLMWEINNRSKRGVAIDLRASAGQDLLHRLVATADVFLTSLSTEARRAMGIDVEDVVAANPSIVYAKGSGQGPLGPDADRGGFDLASFWARTGISHSLSHESEVPVGMPAAGFGDVTSGFALAGGVAAALVRRAATGAGAVVDVSLLGTGLWSMGAEVTGTTFLDQARFYKWERSAATNPICVPYRTADGRFVQLVMLEADVHWPDLCERIGRPDLLEDERFRDQAARREHAAACIEELARTFASRTLAQWEDVLAGAKGVWAPVRSPAEVASDPQVAANGYLRWITTHGGVEVPMVPNPVAVDGATAVPGPAPEHGVDTVAVLGELGLDMDELLSLKIDGVIV